MDTISTVMLPPRRPIRFGTVPLRLLCLLFLSGLGGCASSPFSDSVHQATRSQPAFAEIAAHPEALKGRMVLLGGTIVQTTNLPNTTEIEVLHRPLERYGDRPEDTDQSSGRFLVRCAGFLDSAIYAQGREITAAGPVEAPETRPLDQTQYRYPVIGCQQIHLWPNPPPVYPYPAPYWYGPGWGYWPGIYPYWGPYW